MASAGNKLSVRPDVLELELSIFGPGFGEALALHLGHGKWAVIDSCLDPASRQPAALHYLESIGVNPAESVELVVATHWHDDHIQGISEVFAASPNARFVCTGVLGPPVLQSIVASWTGTNLLPLGSGVDELQSILKELQRRTRNSRCPAPVLGSSDKLIWPRNGKENPLGIRITCLSPSDAAVVAARLRLEELVPAEGKARRRVPAISENDASIVLSVEAHGHRLLLGGDLEVRSNRSLGWLAIVDNHGGSGFKHHAFKVPHHGSATSDHDEIWGTLLTDQPYAATTPFVRGHVRLPKLEDGQRILKRSEHTYLSAPPTPGKFRDPNRTLEKTVSDVTRSVHVVPGKFGHVRFRKMVSAAPEDPWQVELFGSGLSIADYVRQRSEHEEGV